jgi:hypothetical protein
MRPIMKSIDREPAWGQMVADIRLKYRNRPKFMEILDKLASGPIVSAGKKRGLAKGPRISV